MHFLHCTTRPPIVVDHLYDRRGVMPKRVGKYTMTYADGSREVLRLQYRRHITQWNSKLGAGDIAWQGNRADGALVTVCAWEWVNPHPDRPVASVSMARGSDLVDLIVLGVTARDAR
ncbi:MAG TPA: hypothetical protein EYP14_04445 [Planctomycetaceae bacterium]|nr:hypothetical protein [Planctomycetaceae bacterium]